MCENTFSDMHLLLISVYGPNTNDKTFFNDLREILSINRDVPVVCAGDWNLTYSTCSTTDNIDIINMLSPPSAVRSGYLSEICDNFDLTDPFRALHFRSRDFTYVP
jgi:exonuclease III